MKKIIILSFSILIFPSVSPAQQLSLYSAVQTSLDHYPLIRERRAQVAQQQAHVHTVNGYKLPSLLLHDELVAGTDNSLPGSYLSLGIVPSASGGVAPKENTHTAAGNIAVSLLQWQFYNFGYYRAREEEAKAQLASGQAYLNSDRYALAGAIVSLYLDWLKKYRLLQVQLENVTRNATILTAIRATVNSGLKPGVDSATASAQYADARLSYLQALDDYTADKIALSAYTGQDTTALTPDTSIALDKLADAINEYESPDSVATTHPLLNVFQREYQQQLATQKADSKQFLPKVGLIGAAWTRNSGISPQNVYTPLADGMPNYRYNYLAGITVGYNIFDLRHQKDVQAEDRYEAERKLHALETEQLTLTRDLQQANASYAIAVQKLATMPAQLRSATDAYTQQQALYRAGLTTLIEVTNALYVLDRTETEYVLAQDAALQLLSMKAALNNHLFDFLEHFK
jgi:outer membrane protein, adhesin transport system